ncbi:eukaryotic translation initiation factor 3 subunit 6 [Coprinopsis cinerea okayama7|uniref:Eukaryotic translation initiation factor 3 subunit E n=1 Tax=Coprinopsis cinerea (strain Okayama-7 / 130 / ATCC MYA-4618 / FGSC 9003) TaxID=240176 RepID=A8P8E3_COPC7|nr:eukaryotic translation initiation factor 3 subunit 6 [Coprinopsis cinerea okayama7\|eukprot:XP_001839554.1 eukaryotic translation initiation factor 3 subunit 6 [Coprinopsis cinerea okayama7\
MAEHDLTKTIIPYLDRHLAFPLLAHLAELSIFTDRDVQIAQYELVKGTNMYDYSAQLFKSIYPDQEVPAEFEEARKNALSTHERLQQEAQAVFDVIENPEVAQALRQDKIQNLQYLKDNYNLTLEQITALYHYGKFRYSSGNYSSAADYLYHFRVLSTDAELNTSAHWGKLASDILSGRFDVALEELNTLRETIDTRTSASLLAAAAAASSTSSSQTTSDPALIQLHSRTWLVHWSLFVYFNHPEGRTLLLETFLSPTYLNTIQTASPWILRYLAAAAILSRKTAAASNNSAAPVSSRVRHAIREVVKVIQTEEYQYQDPITNFLRELYVEFDFERAQQELSKAEEVVSNDFFLNQFVEEFLDNARYLISEAYCRIHQKIDIADLSARLNLSPEDGEKWIVNLIRETRMGADAKIDLGKNVIEINRPPQPVYQTVIEKTRGLALRTQAMGAALGRAAALTHQQLAQQQQQGGQGQQAQGGQQGGQRQQEAKVAQPPPAGQTVAVA